MFNLISRVIPTSLKSRVREWINEQIDAKLNGRQVLAVLHEPCVDYQGLSYRFYDPSKLLAAPSEDGLPIPPPNLRMGYDTESDRDFLESARRSGMGLRTVMSDHGIAIQPGDAVMDWGCATGRVLRCFAQEARSAVFWGVDQHVPSITWAKENLSPPFRFVTSTSYPHLPFEDHSFKLIYAFSVLTHIEHLSDMWLMELNRIMEKGGYAIVTIHDEHTVKYFQENHRPWWIPTGLELSEILDHDVSIISGPGWSFSYTFFRSEWVRKEFGRYFDVLEIRPYTEGYQSAVVLRKS